MTRQFLRRGAGKSAPRASGALLPAWSGTWQALMAADRGQNAGSPAPGPDRRPPCSIGVARERQYPCTSQSTMSSLTVGGIAAGCAREQASIRGCRLAEDRHWQDDRMNRDSSHGCTRCRQGRRYRPTISDRRHHDHARTGCAGRLGARKERAMRVGCAIAHSRCSDFSRRPSLPAAA